MRKFFYQMAINLLALQIIAESILRAVGRKLRPPEDSCS